MLIRSFTCFRPNHEGIGVARLIAILPANIKTAVNSANADTGSTCHAAAEIPPYASGSPITRIMHPAVISNNETLIHRALHSSLLFRKLGRIRGPIEKISSAKNPTVKAWREAPRNPGPATPKPSSADTPSHPYANRANCGYRRSTPVVLGFPARP